jgi:hypothetical protein
MKGCSELFMRVLATNLQEEYYRPGELLVREGDVSFQLLFLTVGHPKLQGATMCALCGELTALCGELTALW